jgi:hypothetical protein
MYNPNTHMEISRARHADLLREARSRELARRFSEDKPGLLTRLRARFGAERSSHPAPRTA